MDKKYNAKRFDPNDEFAYNFDITTKKDRLIRVCCANYQLLKVEICNNKQLFDYLKQRETHPQLFVNITAQMLLDHCDPNIGSSHITIKDKTVERVEHIFEDQRDTIKRKKDDLKNAYFVAQYSWEVTSKWRVFLANYNYCFAWIFFGFVFPLFVVTRIFYFVFPIICVINEFKYYVGNEESNQDKSFSFDLIFNIIKNNDIVIFQVVLLLVYFTLAFLWIVYFINVLKFYYWVKFLGVGSGYWSIWNANKQTTIKDIVRQYNQMYDDLIISSLLCEYLGTDIASVVFKYYLYMN